MHRMSEDPSQLGGPPQGGTDGSDTTESDLFHKMFQESLSASVWKESEAGGIKLDMAEPQSTNYQRIFQHAFFFFFFFY